MAPDFPAMVAGGGIHALFGRSAQRLRSVKTDYPCLLLLIGRGRPCPLAIDETKLDPQAATQWQLEIARQPVASVQASWLEGAALSTTTTLFYKREF